MPSFRTRIGLILYLMAGMLSACASRPEVPHPPGQSSAQFRRDPASDALFHFARAQLLIQEKRFDEAEKALLNALELDPRSNRLRLLLGQLRLRKGDAEGAVQVVEEALAEHPDFVEGHLFLGGLSFNRGDYAAAVKHFEEVVRLDPERDPVLLHLGMSYERLQQQGRAIDAFRRFLERRPESIAGLAHLARACQQQGDGACAEDAYRHIIELQPDQPGGYIELADLLVERGDLNGAAEVLRGGIEQSTQPGLLRHRLVGVFVRQKNYDEAMAVLERLMADNPEDLEARRKKGLLLMEMGDSAGAAGQFAAILEKKPDLDRVRYFYGLALERLERWQEAFETFDGIAPESDLVPDADFHKAFVLQNMGRLDQAADVLQGMLDRGIARPDIYDYLAGIYDQMGEMDRALAVLRQGYKRFPEEVELLYRQGVVYERNNLRRSAVAVMLQVLEQDPDHPEALNHVAYSYAEDNTELDRALEMVNRALERKKAPHIYDTLGWVLYRLGRNDEALAAMKKAVEGLPSDPVVLDHLARVYLALGQKDLARRQWQRALEVDAAFAPAREGLQRLGGSQ